MKPNKLNIILLLSAVVLTLLVIGGYRLVPPRVAVVVPLEEWRSELFIDYNHENVAANSWVEEAGTHFRCDLLESDAAKFCGINFFYGDYFHIGTDYSKYTHIKLKAKYRGTAARVRIFFRNYNPEYSSPNDGNSAKFLSVVLNTAEFLEGNTVEIGLDEFVVGDWWLSQRKLDRQFLTPEFGNISTIGFDFGPYLEGVNDLEFGIESLTFEGPLVKEEQWYLGILGFWIVVVLGIIVQQFVALMRRSKIYAKVITDLVTDNASLGQESKKFQELSNLDRLTGALNRLGIEKNIERILSGQRSKVIGMVLIDLDHFKRINDHCGHSVGDIVLKTLVEVIQANIREHDILGRWGGEEFVLIAPNANEEIAFRIAEKIRALLANYTFNLDKPLKVTASLGVTAIYPDENFEIGFKRADAALYKAKNNGRNCTFLAEKN